MLRCPMLFLWFDHPLIEGWREARLHAELHREHASSPENSPLERLEVPGGPVVLRLTERDPRPYFTAAR